MEIRDFIEENADKWGIFQYGFMKADKIVCSDSVRKLCESNSCGFYGRTWTCPPAVGTYEECRTRLKEYDNVFVFSTKHELEDSFDFEGMMDGMREHGEIAASVIEAIKPQLPEKHLIFSGGSCKKCQKCSYPEPCRFPDTIHPTIESYGVEVNKLAASAGVNYINGQNTVTYIGCVLW